MKYLALILLLPVLSWGHKVIEKQCPECGGLCVPIAGGGSATLMICMDKYGNIDPAGCCNTTTVSSTCRITGKQFETLRGACDSLKWVIDYEKLKIMLAWDMDTSDTRTTAEWIRDSIIPFSAKPDSKLRTCILEIEWLDSVAIKKCDTSIHYDIFDGVDTTRTRVDTTIRCDVFGYYPTRVKVTEKEVEK